MGDGQRSETIIMRVTPALKATLRSLATDLGVTQTAVVTTLLHDLFGRDEHHELLALFRDRVSRLRRELDAMEQRMEHTAYAEEIPPGDERRARMVAAAAEAAPEPEITPQRARELRTKYPALTHRR